LRRAYFFTGLTLLLILFLIFMGIPLLIRLATFLGEIRGSFQSVESQDKTPPPPPRAYNLPKATNQSELKIEGSSEADSKVKIFLNGKSAKEVATDKNGSFTAMLSLSGQRNEITLQAEDGAGNKSQESEKLVVLLDKEPPELEFLSGMPTEAYCKEGEAEIHGQTEPRARVLVNDRLVILDQKGEFKYSLLLSSGENSWKIVVQDEAGNTKEEEFKVTCS
jgi:hypothetical protein